jgi:hypothetical protein
MASGSTKIFPNFTGQPATASPTGQRKFDTGIPGFDVLAQAQSGNTLDMLTGAPSLDRNRNAGATFAASMGLAPAGGTGDFMDRWNYDLYGQQSDARKQQGNQNLLNMLQAYSGTAVARPGDIMGQETAYRGQDIQRELGLGNLDLGRANLGENMRQFDIGTGTQASQFNRSQGQQQNQFDANLALQSMLGMGNLTNDTLNTYLKFLG